MTEVASQTVDPSGPTPKTGAAGDTPLRSFSGLAFAYWLHLVVPMLLLLDILYAYHLHMTLRTDLLLGAATGAWILAAVLAYVLARDRTRLLLRLRGPLLSFYAVILALGSVELGLRLARRDLPPAIWRPGMRLVFRGAKSRVEDLCGQAEVLTPQSPAPRSPHRNSTVVLEAEVADGFGPVQAHRPAQRQVSMPR